MTELAKSEIFFLVTTLAILVVSAGLIMLFAYALSILREVKEIVGILKSQAKLLSIDVDDVRAKIRQSSFGWAPLWGAVSGLWNARKGRTRRKK